MASSASFAQLTFNLTQNQISLKKNTLVSFTAKVVNQSKEIHKGTLLISADSTLQIISQSHLEVQLDGGDSIFLPVKLLPAYNIEAGDHVVILNLLQQNNRVITKQGHVYLPKIRSVSISSILPAVQLLGNEDSVIVPIRIENTGNVLAAISIVTSLPEEIMHELIHKPLLLHLNKNVDTTIYISHKLPRKLPAGNAFQLNIFGFYTNGEQFGQTNVRVQLLSSEVKQAFTPASNYVVNSPNSLTVSAQNAFSQNGYYWINGGSTLYLPSDTRLLWHTDATIYKYNPGNPYLRDTWINVENHGRGVTIGNLSRNLDLNLYGRGAAVYAFDSLHSTYYESGVIDHSSNLIQSQGSDKGFTLSRAMASWALMRHQLKQFYWQSAAIYQKDEMTATNNTLVTNDFKWNGWHHLRMEASIGAGLSSDLQGINHQKAGALASFSITGAINQKLSISSSNIFSTSYYPGQKKGAQVISTRMGYRANKIGLWSALNYYHYRPKTVSSLYDYQSTYGSTRAEIGISSNLKTFSFSLSPYYTSNYSLFYSFYSNLTPKISAWRVLSQINYNQNQLSAFLSADLGTGNNYLTNKHEFQWRLNSNLRYGLLSISSSFQRGSFYATDALNGYLAGKPIYKLVTLSPRIQYYLFHRNLNINAGVSYNYVNTSGKNLSIDTRFQYKLTNTSSLSATYMRYSTGFTNNAYNNLQLSFSTRLPTARIGTQKSALEVFFYKDLNNNGVYDKEMDSVAAGQQITINNVAFLTDKNGKVLYKNLPLGAYNINNTKNSQWYSDGLTVLLNKKKLRVQIPMHKIGMVEGSVSYRYTRFSYEVNRQKQGITVKAIDKKGRIFTTLTDSYGHFTLYLPASEYTLFIDGTYLPNEIECIQNKNVLQVTPDSRKAVDFVLHVKDRKIETKKFYSTSLTKNETASNTQKNIKGDAATNKGDKAPRNNPTASSRP